MASEILNCDVGKINEFFTSTESELFIKERKKSGLSNTGSELNLSDDHLNINAANIVDKVKDEEEIKEKEDEEKIEPIEKDNFFCEETKSINDLGCDTQNLGVEIDNLQKNKIELLDFLLTFIETDKELNYVLAGYFSKFLLHLLNKHPQKVSSTS
jgi:hypothetical protein